jgi:HTH-type transcriptional regulator / antitoxin HigA
MKTQLRDIGKVWPDLQAVLSVPHDEKDYKRLVGLLDSLIDEVGNDGSHPLASLMETLGSLIETYEDENVPNREGNPIEALKALMEEHDLKQSDLPEVGSQGVVSEVLAGRRQLNIRQIKALSERFGVSPAVFI